MPWAKEGFTVCMPSKLGKADLQAWKVILNPATEALQVGSVRMQFLWISFGQSDSLFCMVLLFFQAMQGL